MTKTLVILGLMFAVMASAVALQMPWEKDGAAKGGKADGEAPAAPAITAVEFVYRGAMDEMHRRHGGKLRVGDPKIGPKEIRVHVAVVGEGRMDLVFVERENNGKSAMVVVGPPESEGEPYYLARAGDSWTAVVTAEAAAQKVMALAEVVELAKRLGVEPGRFGAPAARVEEAPSDEQREQRGFRFQGIAVGYDDNELARFMVWQRFAVDEAGKIWAYDVASDKYVSVEEWRKVK